MSITLFGITFHAYGFIIGVAIAAAALSFEFTLQRAAANNPKLKKAAESILGNIPILLASTLFLGLPAARLWHVATDWYLYQPFLADGLWITLRQIGAVQSGGMSILGGIGGAVVGAWLGLQMIALRENESPNRNEKNNVRKQLAIALDVAVFALPLGQFIGRLGNYVNQELYGLPTDLPWAIFIDPQNRVVDYETFAYFHPLFVYEMIGTGLWLAIVWWLWPKITKYIGSLKLFVSYLAYYAVLRTGLDFLRIEKSTLLGGAIGVNQLILVGVVCICSWWLLKGRNA